LKIVADENIPFVEECFSSIGEVEVLQGRLMNRDVLKDATALLVRSITPVDRNLLEDTNVKFVGTATTGDEHIDKAYLESRGVGFASAPGSNANSVAEYVIAALLSVARKKNVEPEGKSVGIIGVGHIGSIVGRKVKALGMQPLLNDPPLQRRTTERKYRPLEGLYDCDFITLHVPLTYEGEDKTYHMIDEKFFGFLKEGSIFINTSRGGVADTTTLKNVMSKGGLRGVILDVWENEPDIDYELLRKVDIGTPHIAGYSLDGKVNGVRMIYEAMCKYFDLNINLNIEDFLPEPEKTQVNIECRDKTEQDILHQAIQQVYAINRDDFNMREILMVPEQQRGAFFDDLRKHYPVRREFHNTKIVMDKPCDSLINKFKGIGFRI